MRPEFSPDECPYGEKCRFEHDLRKYLKDWKREDLTTFGGICPIWKMNGRCNVGWKCRFVGSHMVERKAEDGRQELILSDNPDSTDSPKPEVKSTSSGTINDVSVQARNDLTKRKFKTPRADAYNQWLSTQSQPPEDQKDYQAIKKDPNFEDDVNVQKQDKEDNRARYISPPMLPSEKRKIYFGPETPVLAPLTTQGNLPFRRLCVNLGAQLTYSEMAMSLPLIQGQKSEWALMRAHEIEATPPSSTPSSVVQDYDKARDLKFGAQIAANKPWQAVKTAEILTTLCPHLRLIDLNCGCPIDLVYRTGAGSALLDSQAKLEKIVRGMNTVSNDVPVTVKIRMGTKDNRPTALKLVERLVYGGEEAQVDGRGGSGVAAITLHGRSRQQRYTKSADWEYIADCAALIKRFNEKGYELADTVREADPRTQPAGRKVYFIGNGDCYSHVDYQGHLLEAKVDSVMVARGALIKPWVFEEIEKGQYLDKSATERLALVEQFVRYGLETWGSDEMGVGTTRRFLLEWLSFAYRYVPVGIMEHLPPKLQDRPPAWRGRNDLETLLGSDNYKDWIKIRLVSSSGDGWRSCANRSKRNVPRPCTRQVPIRAEAQVQQLRDRSRGLVARPMTEADLLHSGFICEEGYWWRAKFTDCGWHTECMPRQPPLTARPTASAHSHGLSSPPGVELKYSQPMTPPNPGNSTFNIVTVLANSSTSTQPCVPFPGFVKTPATTFSASQPRLIISP